MKKNIIIISIALIGLILVFNGHSWAANNRGGPHQKWDKPSNAIDKTDRGRGSAPGVQYDRPEGRFIPRLHQPDHHRAPSRFAPKPRPRFHRPFYRPFHPRWNYWRHHHGAVMNNFYRSAENYAPEDEFSASATISNAGFSVSFGVRETN